MTGSFFHTFYNWSKKHISIIVLVFGIVLSAIPTNSIYAAARTGNPGPAAATPAAGTPAAPAQPAQPAAAPSTSTNSSDIQCGIGFGTGTLMGCVAQGSFMILGLAAWVLWVAAVLFNFAIPYTLNMATFLKDVPIVALGWTTFRDLANIFFIFIVLYIAISTIIGNEGFGFKKLLGKVIVGAVLINFSLFFTQAMIDVSNIFTLEFYNKITQTDGAQAAVAGKSTGTTAPGAAASKLDSGISASLVNALGLDTIWNIGKSDAGSTGAKGIDPNKNAASLGLNATNLLIASLGGTILVLITAFIFFAAVIMFLARAVTLIFLMILSPIAFLGNVLPAIGKYTGEWWSKLFNNLLFAPAYMALLYLVISIIADPNKFKGIMGEKGSFVSVFAGDSNMIGAVMTFVVLNMMMFACLIIASKFGVAGSKWAEKAGSSFAGGAAMMFSGAGLGAGIARTGLGFVGDAGVSAGRVLSTTGLGRVFGGSALLRGGAALKDVKVGGASYKDSQKATEERITKDYDLMKDVDTSAYANLRRRPFESEANFKIRQDAASAKAKDIEKEAKRKADARVGISVDSSGKVTKSHFGAPKIFGSASARYKAQKAIAKKRGGDDVNDEIKKPYEDAIEAAKRKQKEILADVQYDVATKKAIPPTSAAHSRNQEWKDQMEAIKDATKAIKDINGAFTPPKT